MKIAITGATGFIGSHLAEALVTRGHEVTCLARGPEKLRWISGLPVRVIYGDVCGGQGLTELVSGQDAVIHTAGLTRAREMDELLRVNVSGTENLLSAIKTHAPRLHRFMYFSSQAAMGPSPDGIPLGEESVQNPLSMYGRSKHLAEVALRKFRDCMPMTVIRPPTVFGPRDRDVYAYFKLVRRGVEPIIGYANRISLVYVKNLVHGIALALERPMGSFRSYFFTDGPALSWLEIGGLIGAAMGKHTLKVKIPAFAVRAAAEVSELFGAITNHAALISRDKVEEMRQEYWLVSDQRARSELGYRPLYSTEQGIGETVEWYRSEGWL